MAQEVAAKWLGAAKDFDLALEGAGSLAISADAPRSTDLVLAGLVSCSGRTLLTILGRMRLEIAGLEVRATCQRQEEPPKIFTRVDLYYDIWPGQAPVERVRHALELAEKYCTVFNILKASTEIHMHAHLHAEGQGGVA